MAIRNKNYLNLHLDFSSYTDTNDHPSDIDMSYIVPKDNTWIIGEIKNKDGELKEGQRCLLEKYVNNWKNDAICLFITHDKYFQNGDRVVYVMDCQVREFYYKYEQRWRKPRQYTKVKDVMKYFKERVN